MLRPIEEKRTLRCKRAAVFGLICTALLVAGCAGGGGDDGGPHHRGDACARIAEPGRSRAPPRRRSVPPPRRTAVTTEPLNTWDIGDWTPSQPMRPTSAAISVKA